jgi:hypothetical protein
MLVSYIIVGVLLLLVAVYLIISILEAERL